MQKPLPIYGKGENIRDWLYVEDHARAIDLIYHHRARRVNTYNIGGNNEWKNIDLDTIAMPNYGSKAGQTSREQCSKTNHICQGSCRVMTCGMPSIASKIKHELGWEPSVHFETGLAKNR